MFFVAAERTAEDARRGDRPQCAGGSRCTGARSRGSVPCSFCWQLERELARAAFSHVARRCGPLRRKRTLQSPHVEILSVIAVCGGFAVVEPIQVRSIEPTVRRPT